MSSKHVNSVVGYASATKALLAKYQTELTARGIDPARPIANLDKAVNDLVATTGQQASLRTQMRQVNESAESARETAIETAKSACDLVIGSFGRSSAFALEAADLRRTFLRPRRTLTTETVPPVAA